jgi:hypothetical protein
MNRSNDPWVVGYEFTIEKPFGWVFFYNSKKFLETGEIGFALAGNGPAMVNRYDGTIEFGGTANPPEFYIEEYERKLASRGRG